MLAVWGDPDASAGCLHASSLHGGLKTTTHTITPAADVKELTPEFYYLPDFLENGNGYRLGTRQVGYGGLK